MPSTFTVTGKAGPAQTMTAQTFLNVTRFEYEVYPKSILRIVHQAGLTEIDIGAQTTWTTVLASGHVTVTIS